MNLFAIQATYRGYGLSFFAVVNVCQIFVCQLVPINSDRSARLLRVSPIPRQHRTPPQPSRTARLRAAARRVRWRSEMLHRKGCGKKGLVSPRSETCMCPQAAWAAAPPRGATS
jgi:hypothetical protein